MEINRKNSSVKETIISKAKYLFLNNGIDETSMRDIAAAAQISLGTLVYHFKTKQILTAEIRDLLLGELREISIKKYNQAENAIQQIMLYQLLMQVTIVEDPHIENFFNQLIVKGSGDSHPSDFTVLRYKKIIAEYNITVTDDEIFTYMAISKLVEIGFINLKINFNKPKTYLEIIYLIVESSLLPLGISKETVKTEYQKCLDKLPKHYIEILSK